MSVTQRNTLIIIVAVLFLGISVGNCYAGTSSGGILIPNDGGGSFKKYILDNLEASFTFDEEFNDNVFTKRDDRIFDTITHLKPSVGFSFRPIKRQDRSRDPLVINIGANGEVLYYRDNPQLNKEKLRDLFRPYGSVEVELVEGLMGRANIRANNENVTDISSTGTAFSNKGTEVNKRKITTWNSNFGLNYTFGTKRKIWEIGYNRSQKTYPEDSGFQNGNTSVDRIAIVRTEGSPTGRRIIFGSDLLYFIRKKGRDKENLYSNFFTGVEGKFSSRINGKGAIGFGARDIDKYFNYKKLDLIYNVELYYAFTKRQKAGFFATRYIGYDKPFHEAFNVPGSNFADDTKTVTNRIGARYSCKPLLGLENWGGVSVSVSADYENTNYVSGREDNRYNLTVSPVVKVSDWLTFTPEYKYERKMTTEKVTGYYVNKLKLIIKAEF